MTVSFTDSRWDYIQTLPLLDTFQYACEIYSKTDLKVYVSGILQEVDTHYIVTGSPPLYGINNPDGGNIVFYPDYIPANLVPIAIILDLPLTQLTDYKEGDKFPAETHERALDRLIKIAQQFNNVLGRILRVPFWSTLSNILVEISAGKYLRWNAEGTSIICDSGTTVGAHKGTHEYGGADEISVTGLSGLLADDQHVLDAEVINLVYPVGSIYVSTVATNPGTLFGVGTWAAFGAGRVLVGLDAGQTEFDTVEETGGAKTVSVAHTHTGPSHTHTVPASQGVWGGQAGVSEAIITGVSHSGAVVLTASVDYATGAGGTGATGAMSANAAPSVLQPYIVVYLFKRTA